MQSHLCMAVMGWGRACGRWKVSRHHLLTTDWKQCRVREVCIRQTPAQPSCLSPACSAPVPINLQQNVPDGWGGTPEVGPEVEHCGLIHFSAKQRSPHQGKVCLTQLTQLAKGAALNPQGGNFCFPRFHLISPPRLQILKYLRDRSSLPSSCRAGHRPQAIGQVFWSLSI